MDDEFISYKKFETPEEAAALIENLNSNNIVFLLEDNSPSDDVTSTYGSQVQGQYDVKIRPGDFEKANNILQKEATETAEKLPEDYYLYQFSIDELNDILDHFDEWNETDYMLAQKLLINKGRPVSDEIIRQKKKKRIDQLKEPQKAESGWLIFGFITMVLGGLFGLFIGYYLSGFRKTIPTGEKVYVYDETSRKKGRIMFYLGIVSVIAWIVIYMFVIP